MDLWVEIDEVGELRRSPTVLPTDLWVETDEDPKEVGELRRRCVAVVSGGVATGVYVQ
jgi:hypothetical protein